MILSQIRMDTKENPQQILFVFRVLTGFDCFSTFIMFFLIFTCRIFITWLCTGWIGWFKFYSRLTWCLSPSCYPTVGVANKAAGPSGETNNLGSVRGNLSRQFKQGNIVRKSSSVTVVVWVLKVSVSQIVNYSKWPWHLCDIDSEVILCNSVFFLQKMIFFPISLFETWLKVWSQRFVSKRIFIKDTCVWEYVVVNLVTLTMMILLTARACEVVVSDWRCKPATARIFLALSKYKNYHYMVNM